MESRSLLSNRIVISSLLRSQGDRNISSWHGALPKWVHLDSNQGPAGYEPDALTAELWTRESPLQGEAAVYHSRASSPGVHSPGRSWLHVRAKRRASSA